MRYATEKERTGKGVVHTYRIFYPSGQNAELTGIYMSLYTDEGFMGAIIKGTKEAVILDPRAVIVRGDLLIFEPRKIHDSQLLPWIRDWLVEHPEWPRVVLDTEKING